MAPEKACLLGAPLSTSEALTTCLEGRCTELTLATTRLEFIAKHDALLLLRCSLSSQKLLYTLRCSPCTGHPLLDKFDALLRSGLETVINIDLSNDQWLQASLPVKMGGLGIRRVTSLALPAFLASAASTRALQSSMLGSTWSDVDELVQKMERMWCNESQTMRPDNEAAYKQSSWDKPLLQKAADELSNIQTDPYHQARFKAAAAPHAGDWLFALPVTSCGLRLDDEAVRIAVGLRLGTRICEPHACPCGSRVKADGAHGLSCGLGPGRIARHAALNDLISRSLTRAGFPNIKEPPGLSRTDGKRPDGLTLIPWRRGRSLIWDVTVIDTVAPSYIPATSSSAGAAAETATTRKNVKYNQLAATYLFVPLAFETMGPVNNDGMAFIKDLGRILTQVTRDPREPSYLFQRLSVCIQRFNAVAYRGSFVQL